MKKKIFAVALVVALLVGGLILASCFMGDCPGGYGGSDIGKCIWGAKGKADVQCYDRCIYEQTQANPDLKYPVKCDC